MGYDLKASRQKYLVLLNSIKGLVEVPEPTKKIKMKGKYPNLGAQMNNGDKLCV